MADKSLKNKMRILELEKPLGALLSAVDAMEGGKLSKKRKTRAKLIELKDKLGMEMGGEVMDMTKSQPVNMMDGGKIKKMNMGGVVQGRGGSFKGVK